MSDEFYKEKIDELEKKLYSQNIIIKKLEIKIKSMDKENAPYGEIFPKIQKMCEDVNKNISKCINDTDEAKRKILNIKDDLYQEIWNRIDNEMGESIKLKVFSIVNKCFKKTFMKSFAE